MRTGTTVRARITVFYASFFFHRAGCSFIACLATTGDRGKSGNIILMMLILMIIIVLMMIVLVKPLRTNNFGRVSAQTGTESPQ